MPLVLGYLAGHGGVGRESIATVLDDQDSRASGAQGFTNEKAESEAMSALPDFGYEAYRAQQQARLQAKLEFKALERELYRWGRWVVKHFSHTGHPNMTPEHRASHGGGGGMLGHRILCLEWPDDVYATHHRVLMLSEIEQDVIELKYAICVNEVNGHLWTKADWCQRYGISEDNFRKHLERARKRIQGLPVD